MAKREGKIFENFWPELKDMQYPWPSDRKNYEEMFLDKKSELEEYLLNKTKVYMEKLGMDSLSHPYLQRGRNSLICHIDSGGRYFEIGDGFGNIFSTHNHSFRHDIVAFNVASDVLEYLDEEILAPRIEITENDYILNYFLPKELRNVSLKKYEERIINLASLQKEEVRIVDSKNQKELDFLHGNTIFKEGLCKLNASSNFRKYSWMVARTLGILSSKD